MFKEGFLDLPFRASDSTGLEWGLGACFCDSDASGPGTLEEELSPGTPNSLPAPQAHLYLKALLADECSLAKGFSLLPRLSGSFPNMWGTPISEPAEYLSSPLCILYNRSAARLFFFDSPLRAVVEAVWNDLCISID